MNVLGAKISLNQLCMTFKRVNIIPEYAGKQNSI